MTVGLTLGLAACNDDDSYPECGSVWWCDFEVSSSNLGSTNYWIYGENPRLYYYFDGSKIGSEYVSIEKDKADNCAEFDRHDVLTWDACDTTLDFNCDFIKQAKVTFNRYSSATARKSDRYPEGGPDGPLSYDCSR